MISVAPLKQLPARYRILKELFVTLLSKFPKHSILRLCEIFFLLVFRSPEVLPTEKNKKGLFLPVRRHSLSKGENF